MVPPMPDDRPRRVRLRPLHFLPLVGFLVPSIVIGYGFVLPGSCGAGVNELSIGFGASLVGAAVTYVAGVVAVARG